MPNLVSTTQLAGALELLFDDGSRAIVPTVATMGFPSTAHQSQTPTSTQGNTVLLDATGVGAGYRNGALYFVNTTDVVVTFEVFAELNGDVNNVVTFTLPAGNGTAQRIVVTPTASATISGSGPTYTLNTAAVLQALLGAPGMRFKVEYSATSPTTGTVAVELNQN